VLCAPEVVVDPSEQHLFGRQVDERVDGLALLQQANELGMRHQIDTLIHCDKLYFYLRNYL